MSEKTFLIFLASGTIIQYLIYCLYLRNLSRLLKAIQPANRHIAPGQVWLLLLWIINLICGYLDTQELEYLRTSLVRDVCRGIDISVYLFLLFWQFRVVHSIAASIENEYKSRSLPISSRPTYYIGLVMVLLGVVYIAEFLPDNNFTSTVAQIGGIGNTVFWIIYWIRTHQYKKKIQAMPPYQNANESPVFSNLY